MSIFKKIPLIMGEVGAIEKNRRGDGINYKFRGIDDLYFALQPLLAKHGVFYTPCVKQQQREERTTKSGGIMTYTILTIDYTFFSDDGSNVTLTTAGEAMDTSDKSTNKAMSAALKYALLQLFCIPTEEEKDTEYQNHEPSTRSQSPQAQFASPAQVARLFSIAKSVGMPVEELKKLCEGMGIKSSTEIPKSSYEAICSTVERWNS